MMKPNPPTLNRHDLEELVAVMRETMVLCEAAQLIDFVDDRFKARLLDQLALTQTWIDRTLGKRCATPLQAERLPEVAERLDALQKTLRVTP